MECLSKKSTRQHQKRNFRYLENFQVKKEMLTELHTMGNELYIFWITSKIYFKHQSTYL